MSDPTSASSEPEHSGDAHMSKPVNKDGDSLSHHMNRMSLAAAASTALPPSSPVVSSDPARRNDSPSTSSRSVRTPIRRAPSSGSLGGNEKPSPPALHKRTSVNSLKETGGKTPPRSPAPRRSSSYFHNLSMGDRSSLPPPVEEAPKAPATAATVAREFFEKELEAKHGSTEGSRATQTVVILQDACYGHRYSRPKTSKGALSMIVERPERIQASLLGVATAYVRLGGHHAEGTAAPHPQRDPASLPAAPFKIHKTPRTLSLRSPAAAAVHGKEWMEELTVMCDKAEAKLAMNGKELTRENVNGQLSEDAMSEKAKLHEGDLYLCSESLNALEGALGGVCEGVDAVFGEKGPKRAFVCIRPPGHHCAADMPSGFCWINNVHVGIGHGAITHGLTHAAIIDFDLHHGDGSQSITWAHNTRVASLPKNTPMTKKTPIGYFSLHDINSYPCEMGDEEKVQNASLCIENAHGQSIWNVHLQPWKTVSEFWALYEDRYLVLLAKARAFLKAHSDRLRQSPTHPKPKAAIFLSAGFDASEWESPGMQRHQVHVPTEFYARFTHDVVTMAEEEALGVDGRVISVLEGGYSDRALMSGTLSHLSGLAAKTGTSRPSTSGSNGLGQDVNRVGALNLSGGSLRGSTSKSTIKQEGPSYDPTWWSVSNLEELETLIDPMAHVAPPSKGPRGKVQPTFTLPTESFISKVVEAPQGRRSTSGAGRPAPTVIPRSASPPPPEVGWATASLELRNLLVPVGRETKSCKPEDLNAEATRRRRDRQSNIGVAGLPAETSAMPPMQLREKRGKAPEVKEEERERAASRASRRKTIADPNLFTKGDTPPPMSHMNRPVRRRSSAASSIVSAGTMNTDRGSDFDLPPVIDQREPLAVKKARAPVIPRAEAAKPKTAVKRPAVARKPSASSTATTKSTERVPTTAGSAPLSVNVEAQNKDVDQLASGMKGMSIKLNVPPKEEYDAREQKAKPAPRGRPPKPSAAKTTKARSPTKAKAKAPVAAPQPVSFLNLTDTAMQSTQPEPVFPAPAPAPPLAPSAGDVQEPNAVPQLPNHLSAPVANNAAPTPAPLMPPMQPIQQPPPVSDTTIPTPDTPRSLPQARNSTFTSFSDDPPPFSPITPAQAAQAATPITAKRNTKENLPIFTATSPISFGKPTASNSIDQAITPVANAGSSHPSRPMSSAPPAAATSTNNNNAAPPVPRPEYDASSGPFRPPPETASESQYLNANGAVDKVEAQQMRAVDSIWDVPDTPQARKS